MDESGSDIEYVNCIASDVIRVLEENRFFELLDDLFCPSDPNANDQAKCGHSFDLSSEVLRGLGMDADDIEDVLAVLASRGACCDCEVLYNVAEVSRLKTQYWASRNS